MKSYLSQFIFAVLTLAAAPALFAVDGVVLINQATATTGLPGCGTGDPYVFIKICQPGSYRLSSNITVTDPAKSGIQILASNVTLDLNGFTILGASCPANSLTCTPLDGLDTRTVTLGILGATFNFSGYNSSGDNRRVLNGTIRGFHGAVNLFTGGRAESLDVVGGIFGIVDVHLIINCTIIGNSRATKVINSIVWGGCSGVGC